MDIAVLQPLFKKFPTHRMAYSDRMALLMATMAQLAYETDIEKTREMLKKIDFRLRRHFDVDDTQAFIAENEDFSVLAFRGTESARDALTDMYAVPFCDGKKSFHKGFKKAFDRVASEVQAVTEKIEKPIFVTGHSLGGALAIIACCEILSSEKVAACYTFGSPAAGDAMFRQAILKFPVYRVVNLFDVVTRVPPWYVGTGYLTILAFGQRIRGQQAYFLFSISYFLGALFFFPLIISAFVLRCLEMKFFFGLISDHFLHRYIENLTAVAHRRQNEEELSPRQLRYQIFGLARFVASLAVFAGAFYIGYRLFVSAGS